MVELLTGENPHLTDFTVVHDGKGLPIRRRSGFEYFHLASYFKGKISEPFLVKAPYREEEQDREIHTSVHDGQEFDYVLEGELKYKIHNQIVFLKEGDSIMFDSSSPHGMVALVLWHAVAELRHYV